MKLSVIIVSFNVKSYLRQCLNSVLASTQIDDLEIIVIDNHSFDGSCNLLKNEYPQIKLIENKKNMGFSVAVNQGIDIAKGDYVCFLNPDTLIQEDTFSKLISHLKENPEVGCIGPKILNPDGSLQKSCKRSFPTPLVALPKVLGLSRIFPKSKWFGKYNLTYLDENTPHFVDAISGSFMLFPQELVESVGKLDESFFMFGEDLDYSFRVKQTGYKVLYQPETEVIHYKGESVKSAPQDMIKVFYEAMNIFFEKYKDDYPSWRFMKWLVKMGIHFRKLASFLTSSSSRISARILDTSSIGLSFFLAISLWYPLFYSESNTTRTFIGHMPLILNLTTCWLLSSYLLDLYKKDLLSYGRAIITSVLTLFLSATSTYFISVFAFSRGVLLLSALFIIILTCTWRIGVHILYRYRKVKIDHRSPLFTRRAAILDVGIESQRISNILKNSVEADFKLIGHIGKSIESNNLNCLGHKEDISKIVKFHNINELIIPESYLSIKELIILIRNISGHNTTFKIVPSGSHLLIGKGIVENLSGITLINLEFPIFDKIHLIFKRFFDMFFSLLLILILSPLLIYLKFFTKIEKRNIWCEDGRKLLLSEFSTSIGWMRELPYLFSILRGSLSFVGCEIVDVTSKNPDLLFKPGLTGLSQLRRMDAINSSESNIEHFYIQNQSLVFDLEILFKSILKV
ncbi:glycosyltransferase [Candidatus Marinimicrobia bacterium]|nr:glycosyltransferase [Candidatus Neomarinimicrobiota bacterium]